MTELICMFCGNTNLRCVQRDRNNSTYECRRCNSIFEIDNDIGESDESIFLTSFANPIRFSKDARNMRAQNYALEICPQYRKLLADGEIVDFLMILWDWNHWNNRGNEPSFEEYLESQFESDIRDIITGTGDLQEFFDRQIDDAGLDNLDIVFKGVYAMFMLLRKKYSEVESKNVRSKKGILRRRCRP